MSSTNEVLSSRAGMSTTQQKIAESFGEIGRRHVGSLRLSQPFLFPFFDLMLSMCASEYGKSSCSRCNSDPRIPPPYAAEIENSMQKSV
jgi:hypothetical protein